MKAVRERQLRKAAMVKRRWGKKLRQWHRATARYLRETKGSS